MKQFKIDNEYILSLKPCADRRKNYLKHYRKTSFSVVEFLKLDKITYADKLWVWRRFAEKVDAVQFAIACAESVLPIFQRSFPDDNRPRKAIEAARKWCEEQTEENIIAAKAAAAAATDAIYSSHAAAAAAAATDAIYSSHAADAAIYAAIYAARAAAAYDAAYDAICAAYSAYVTAYDAVNKEVQEQLNLKFLIEIYERKELLK